jgi:predicted DNA-binding transcriptional regulator AlpA
VCVNNIDSAGFDLAQKKQTSVEAHNYLTMQEVVEMFKISRMHLYRLRKAGLFAKPVMESPIRWRLKDIEVFMDRRASATDE